MAGVNVSIVTNDINLMNAIDYLKQAKIEMGGLK